MNFHCDKNVVPLSNLMQNDNVVTWPPGLISITINNIIPLAHFKKTIIITLFLKKWAATRDFQQCGILRSVDTDEPVQPSVKLRNFKWYLVGGSAVMEYSVTSKVSDQTARMRRLVWAFAGRTYLIVGNLMSWLKYVRHCPCNALYVYCRGRAVTYVGKTCGPTPCFVLAINTFKLNWPPRHYVQVKFSKSLSLAWSKQFLLKQYGYLFFRERISTVILVPKTYLLQRLVLGRQHMNIKRMFERKRRRGGSQGNLCHWNISKILLITFIGLTFRVIGSSYN